MKLEEKSKETKTKTKIQKQVVEGLPVIREHVGGIDLGSKLHWACAPLPDGSGREIASFEGSTPELQRLVEWLREHQVKSVAMESTGVYWIPPHEMLVAAGFEVLLADTKQVKSVPGRSKKSDPEDCQWIQRLHSCGLLNGSFLPEEAVCMLRTAVRDKATLVAEAGDWLRRMQKSLDQMNVRVHRAVSDLDGETGMAMVRAIVKGERDPKKLARLRNRRCHKTEKQMVKELTGHWREDHLFSLEIALKMYDSIQERIQETEQQILRQLKRMELPHCQGEVPALKNEEKGKLIKRRGQEEIRKACYRASGVDLTEIDAIGAETVLVCFSEYGPDLSLFDNEKKFVAHTTLAPRIPTSGGKRLKRPRKPNSASGRVAAALRMAALSLRHSNTALGAYYRQIARRKDGQVAVIATARKLATIIFRYLRWGKGYVDIGAEAYEKRYQQQRIQSLKAKAKDLGFQLLPIPKMGMDLPG